MTATMSHDTNPELETYYQRCISADWAYDYSDDGAMWRRGKAEVDGLERAAANDPVKHAIFHGMKAWYWSNPRPERPTLQALVAQAKPAA
ncbi:MAG: hypothetical protein AMXMBFR33_01820 [Candidatus Xenobia bacterium]